MGQLLLPSTTFLRLPGLPAPLPFSFFLLGCYGTEQIHSDVPSSQLGGGDIPLSSRGAAPLLFLTEPSPPATVGPASLMLTKMQIPRGSQGGSRAWLWRGKPSSPPWQGEKGRLLHAPPRHDVGMVTPCPSRSTLGACGQCKATPACPVQARRQQGQEPLPPPNPKPYPLPPLLPLIFSHAHLHGKGILQRGGGARSSIPVAVPILATAAASAPPSPGLLSRLRVWSKLDALKKLFMCVRACVCV